MLAYIPRQCFCMSINTVQLMIWNKIAVIHLISTALTHLELHSDSAKHAVLQFQRMFHKSSQRREKVTYNK